MGNPLKGTAYSFFALPRNTSSHNILLHVMIYGVKENHQQYIHMETPMVICSLLGGTLIPNKQEPWGEGSSNKSSHFGYPDQ